MEELEELERDFEQQEGEFEIGSASIKQRSNYSQEN